MIKQIEINLDAFTTSSARHLLNLAWDMFENEAKYKTAPEKMKDGVVSMRAAKEKFEIEAMEFLLAVAKAEKPEDAIINVQHHRPIIDTIIYSNKIRLMKDILESPNLDDRSLAIITEELLNIKTSRRKKSKAEATDELAELLRHGKGGRA